MKTKKAVESASNSTADSGSASQMDDVQLHAVEAEENMDIDDMGTGSAEIAGIIPFLPTDSPEYSLLKRRFTTVFLLSSLLRVLPLPQRSALGSCLSVADAPELANDDDAS